MKDATCGKLADKLAEYAALPIMAQQKTLWYADNSLQGERPVIGVEMDTFEQEKLSPPRCVSPGAVILEQNLNRHLINFEWIGDDKVVPDYVASASCPVCAKSQSQRGVTKNSWVKRCGAAGSSTRGKPSPNYLDLISPIRASDNVRASANLYGLSIRAVLVHRGGVIRRQVNPLQVRQRRGESGDLIAIIMSRTTIRMPS